VLLTYAGWEAPPGVSAVDGKSGAVQVNGLISGVIENGGACRVTLTSGSVTVSGQSAGVADAKSTDCSVRVTDAALTPGTWKAVLTYQSATSRGSSAPLDVQVAAR
jgi:ferric-dicitrate binding protein FerR (iron transport regulator)